MYIFKIRGTALSDSFDLSSEQGLYNCTITTTKYYTVKLANSIFETILLAFSMASCAARRHNL